MLKNDVVTTTIICVESHIKQNELSTLSLHLRLRPPPPSPPHLTVCFLLTERRQMASASNPDSWKTAGQTHTHTHTTQLLAHTRWEKTWSHLYHVSVYALLLHPLVDSSIGSTSQPSFRDGGADVVRRLGSLPFSWLSPHDDSRHCFSFSTQRIFQVFPFLKYWQHQCKPHQNNVETEINCEMIEIDTLAAKYHEIVRHAETSLFV